MIKIDKDLLLTTKNCNKLIKSSKLDKIFIQNNILNIYAALVKPKYPCKLKSIPYVRGKYLTQEIKSFLNKLPLEFKKQKFLKLRKEFSYYIGNKRLDAILPFWIKNNFYPFTFIRFLSLISSKDKLKQNKYFVKLLKLIDYFTSYNHTVFKPPIILEKLLSPSIVYLVSVAFGDGGIVERKLFKITSGSQNKIELKYTKFFFKKISKILKCNFLLKSRIFKDYENDNKYRIYLINKWFCLYMNFFFGMPLCKKKNLLRKPLILNLSKKKEKLTKIFWRGIFDTDGYIKNVIRLEMCDRNFVKECKDDLSKLGIIISFKERDKIVNGKTHKEYCITIPSTQYNVFAENIGFNYKIKQGKLVKDLYRKSNCREWIFNSKQIRKLKENWSIPFSSL